MITTLFFACFCYVCFCLSFVVVAAAAAAVVIVLVVVVVVVPAAVVVVAVVDDDDDDEDDDDDDVVVVDLVAVLFGRKGLWPCLFYLTVLIYSLARSLA